MADNCTGADGASTAGDDRRPTGEEGADADAPFPPDALFEAFADGRRRAVLGYFAETGAETASTGELADHVAGAEDGATPDRVAVSLRHRHLPELAAADVVDYDRRDRTVRYRGDELVDAWLDAVARGGDA